jgi:hypothetical protein
MISRHLALAALLAIAMPAAAECRWEWLCNGEGACKEMPICGNLYESPSPRPTETRPPPVPPLSLRTQNVSGTGATLICEHIMRRERSGRWYWTEACFCVDSQRSKDKSPPFANIVRCDEK